MNGSTAHDWIVGFSERFARAQDHLTDLDRQVGDGDFGTNISSALRRVGQALPPRGTASVSEVFKAVSQGFLATGGTSGPLFGMFFREMSRACESDDLTAEALARGVVDGLAVVQRLGGAQVGDGTIVDALSPAAGALHSSTDRVRTTGEAMQAAAAAAHEGAQSTADIVAARGRASYVGELGRGVLDPGAVTVALFFEVGADKVIEYAHQR